MTRRGMLAAGLMLPLSGCMPRGGGSGVPRYVVGEPYQAGGIWRYPRENFDYADTGLATILPTRRGQTANGEAIDDSALVAAHRTLQLPSLLRVTNLENGRQILVRVNDRGPEDPARVIALSRRATQLLEAADPRAFRVRLQIDADASRRLAFMMQNRPDAAPADAPKLAVAAAPQSGVQAESLAPPSGTVQSGRARLAPTIVARTTADPPPAEIPQRLPEEIRMVGARPGQLAVECGSFGRQEYAEILRQRIARLGPRVTTDYDAPRDAAFIVRLGPYPSVPQAEAALRQALAAGVPDARIVIE